MRRFVLLLLIVPAFVCAAPDRAGLIRAWEASMRDDGMLEAQADGSYRYRNEAIGRDGGVKLLTAIVSKDGAGARPVDGMGARGSVDFDLPDLPDLPASALRSESMGLLSWKAERQNFFYDETKQAWLSTAEWRSPAISAARGSALLRGCWTTQCRSGSLRFSPRCSGERCACSGVRTGN